MGYLTWIDTEMVRGADRHPVYGPMRAKLPAFARKTYPVSAVGDAVLDGFRRRRRMVVVPNFLRATIALRGVVWRLTDRAALANAAETDELFARDVAERGEQASRAVGAGGAADDALSTRH